MYICFLFLCSKAILLVSGHRIFNERTRYGHVHVGYSISRRSALTLIRKSNPLNMRRADACGISSISSAEDLHKISPRIHSTTSFKGMINWRNSKNTEEFEKPQSSDLVVNMESFLSLLRHSAKKEATLSFDEKRVLLDELLCWLPHLPPSEVWKVVNFLLRMKCSYRNKVTTYLILL